MKQNKISVSQNPKRLFCKQLKISNKAQTIRNNDLNYTELPIIQNEISYSICLYEIRSLLIHS